MEKTLETTRRPEQVQIISVIPYVGAFTVEGKVIDPNRTERVLFGDGTKQEAYFTSAGEIAGQSARVKQ